MEIILLKEVCRILHLKDIRSVINWCKKHNVQVFSELGRKSAYVIKMQFESARLRNVIIHLKEKYKDNWTQVFNAIQSNNLSQYLMIESSNEKPQVTSNYQPSGDNEKSFLSILQNETSEL